MATTTFTYSTTTTRYYCYTSTSTSNKLYYSNAFIKKLGDATTSGNNRTGFVVHANDDWGFSNYGNMWRATRIAPTGTVNGYTFSQLSEASLSQVYVTINSRMDNANRAVAPYFGPCIGSGLQITPSVSVIDSRNGSNTSRSGCFAIQAGTSNGGSSAYNGLNIVYLKTPTIPAGGAFGLGARSTSNQNYGYVAGATVTVIINNPTLTVSAGTGGSVSITSASSSPGATQSITATPATGYSFKGWTCSGGSGSLSTTTSATTTYTYGLTGDTVTASFSSLPTYTIDYNANGHGTAPSSQIKTSGTALTLQSFISSETTGGVTSTYTITGNAGEGTWSGSNGSASYTTEKHVYSQTYWNTLADGSGTNYSSGGSYTTNAAQTFYAIWNDATTAASYTYTLPTGTPTKSSTTTTIGTISVNPFGSSISSTFTSTRTDTYSFSGWFTSDGIQRTTSSQVNADETVYAQFTTNIGTPTSFTTPTASYYSQTGKTLIGWDTSSEATTVVRQCGETYIPTSDETLYGVWQTNSYILTTSAYPEEYGTVTEGGSIDYRGTKSLTATPADGYKFVYWTISGTNASISATLLDTVTFTMGTSDATVIAVFVPLYHTDGNGTYYLHNTGFVSTAESYTESNYTSLASYGDSAYLRYGLHNLSTGTATYYSHVAFTFDTEKLSLLKKKNITSVKLYWRTSSHNALGNTTRQLFQKSSSDTSTCAVTGSALESLYSGNSDYAYSESNTIDEITYNNRVTVSSNTVPSYGFTFKAISNSSASTAGAAYYSVLEYTDLCIVIVADETPHTLTTIATPDGYGTVTEGGSYSYLDEIQLLATPITDDNYTYSFDSWSISGTGASLSSTTDNPVTVTMGSTETTVTATFTRQSKADIHYYNGSTLVDATIYYYNGSALVEADIYYYDGSELKKCT